MKDIEHSDGQNRLGNLTHAPIFEDAWQSTDMGRSDAPVPASADVLEERQQRSRVMQEFNITYDGRSYQYNGYCYDALADAVGYARLMRSQPLNENPAGPFVPQSAVTIPSNIDRKLMTALGISFQAGRYHFQTFRYDRLVDAVNYAQSH